MLNKLPKSQHPKAKRALQEIWMAETKKDALVAFDAFIETWGPVELPRPATENGGPSGTAVYQAGEMEPLATG